MLKGLVLAAALVAGPMAGAQAATAVPMPAGAADELTAQSDVFFGKLKAGQVAEAYKALFAKSAMEKKQSDVEQLVSMTEQALKFYGPVAGWELVKEEAASAYIVKRTYELRTEQVPLIWTVYYYRNAKGWTVLAVSFSDQPAPLFE
jgi:hypothetical protein